MRIITRAEWGARPFRNGPPVVPLSRRRWFIVHYPGAGTPPRNVGDYAKWIERIHMDQNGWRGVGYNFFIGPDGAIAEGCGRDVRGSHSPPHNVDGFGVNIWTSNGVATPESMHAARQLYERLCDQTGRRLQIGWHGMDFPTECPGPQLRSWAKAGMPDPGGSSSPSTTRDPLEEIMNWYKDRQAFEVRLAEINMKYGPRGEFWSGQLDGKGEKIMINVATAFRWAHKIGRETRTVAQEARKVARDNRIKNTRTEGKIDGLIEAVKELAEQQGADTARVERLIQKGVDDVKGELDELASQNDATISDDESDARELMALMADTTEE